MSILHKSLYKITSTWVELLGEAYNSKSTGSGYLAFENDQICSLTPLLCLLVVRAGPGLMKMGRVALSLKKNATFI